MGFSIGKITSLIVVLLLCPFEEQHYLCGPMSVYVWSSVRKIWFCQDSSQCRTMNKRFFTARATLHTESTGHQKQTKKRSVKKKKASLQPSASFSDRQLVFYRSMWIQAVSRNNVSVLQSLLPVVRYTHEQGLQTVSFRDCGMPTRTCMHQALHGFHSAIQLGRVQPFIDHHNDKGSVKDSLLQTLIFLADNAKIDFSDECPVVDAIHFRLVDAVDFLLSKMNASTIARCFLHVHLNLQLCLLLHLFMTHTSH